METTTVLQRMILDQLFLKLCRSPLATLGNSFRLDPLKWRVSIGEKLSTVILQTISPVNRVSNLYY